MFDQLEARRMLTSSLSNGILAVTGTSGNDVTSVLLASGTLRVSESGLADKYYSAPLVTKILVDGKAGNDKITISSGIMVKAELRGNTGNDTIRGGGGLDTLNGGDGNDNLEGGGKGDSLNGGAGTDTIDYSARTTPVTTEFTFDSGTGAKRGGGGAAGEADKYAGAECLISGSAADNLKLTVSSGANLQSAAFEFFAGAGDDRLDVDSWSATTYLASMHGGSGNDIFSLLGPCAASVNLWGDNGSDTFESHVEDSDIKSVDGGDGYDRELFESGGGYSGVTLQMGPGVEELSAGIVWETGTINGNDLNNKISVAFVRDWCVINGGKGNDELVALGAIGKPVTLNGGDGNDLLTGSDGTIGSILHGNSGNDTIRGSKWSDTIYGDSGNDGLVGNAGNDTVLGGSGDDSMQGNDGSDSLDGGAGNDSLDGGAAADTITGGFGADNLIGGSGNDRFFNNDLFRDTVNGGSGTDSAQKDLLDALSSIERILA